MAHYFVNDNNLKSNINIIQFNIFDKEYSLYTDNGVFSKGKLDFGSRLLIESLPMDRIKGNVLDLGCGYGPIGVTVKDNTDATVDMVDVNLRAVHLAKMNVKKYKLENVNVLESDIYSNIHNIYDYIITNPPIRVGKEKLYEMIFKAKEFLTKEGELWLVIRKDQGAKSLLKDMDNEYITEIINKKGGFFVISAKIR